MPQELINNLTNAFVFSIMGLLIFVFGFVFMNKITPADLWHEIIEEHNQALATMVAGISIGLCIIIAACIHG